MVVRGGPCLFRGLIRSIEFSVMCLQLFDLGGLVLQSSMRVSKLDFRLDLFWVQES